MTFLFYHYKFINNEKIPLPTLPWNLNTEVLNDSCSKSSDKIPMNKQNMYLCSKYPCLYTGIA